MAAMTIFERLNRGQPPAEAPIKPPHKSPAQEMLDWLMRWPHETVSSKQIYQYAPRAVRSDRETAIKTAEILERYGWLSRRETKTRGWRVWEITRRPVVYPLVEG